MLHTTKESMLAFKKSEETKRCGHHDVGADLMDSGTKKSTNQPHKGALSQTKPWSIFCSTHSHALVWNEIREAPGLQENCSTLHGRNEKFWNV